MYFFVSSDSEADMLCDYDDERSPHEDEHSGHEDESGEQHQYDGPDGRKTVEFVNLICDDSEFVIILYSKPKGSQVNLRAFSRAVDIQSKGTAVNRKYWCSLCNSQGWNTV